MMPGVGSGTNWLMGGVAAAVLLPLLAAGLNVPFIAAAAIALVAGGGVVLLTAPRRPLDGLDAGAIGRGRIELANELLGDAAPMVDRMRAAAKAIRGEAVRTRVGHLVDAATGIMASVQKDPLKLDRARRFLTYYLPRAAEIAEGYRVLEQRKLPDPDRLDLAFSRAADGMLAGDIDRLDIELKLLRGALDEDLGAEPGGGSVDSAPTASGPERPGPVSGPPTRATPPVRG
jgi:hypothetical protein